MTMDVSNAGRGAPARALHSIIDGAVLAELVARDYGIAAVEPVLLIQHGLNDHYLLAIEQTDFIVRVYRHGWRTPAAIQWELDLIEHLAQHDAPVAACVRRLDGTWCTEVAAVEGRRALAVFQKAHGRYTHFGNNGVHRVSPAECAAQFGLSMAQIHTAADTFTAQSERLALDLDALLDQPLQAITSVYGYRSQELRTLHHCAERLRSLLAALGPHELDWGPCHGDMTGGNSTYHSMRDRVVHFDFDCSGPGWRAYDLGVFRWSMLLNSAPESVWEEFLAGYRSWRPLRERDLAAVPVFAALRIIWLVGLWCANAPVLGAHKLHGDYLAFEVARLEAFTERAARSLA